MLPRLALALFCALSPLAAAENPLPEFGYRPPGISMWDAWHYEFGGKAYMIHLQKPAPGSTRTPEEFHRFGQAVSDDLIHWRELPPGLAPDPANPLDDAHMYTGSAVVHEGIIYLYYTMRPLADGTATQRIGLATSKDGIHWERHPGNPVLTADPKSFYSLEKPNLNGVVDCRDFEVIRLPDGKSWLGFYAACVPSREMGQGGAIGVARSTDLIHWEHLPPAYAPGKYACIEVPDVYQLNGRWYMTCLTGHEYGIRGIFKDRHVSRGTIYAVADKPEGPYREFDADNVVFGSNANTGYSLRTFLFQDVRYGFYIQTVPGGASTLSPPMLLKTTPEGFLRLAYSDRTKAWRGRQLIAPPPRQGLRLANEPEVAQPPRPELKLEPNHNRWVGPAGSWLTKNQTFGGWSTSGYQIASLGGGSGAMEVEATLKLQEGAAVGLSWGPHSGGKSNDLVFMLDAEQQVARAARRPWFDDPYTRNFKVERNRSYAVRISIRPPRFEMFVDDVLVLQFAHVLTPAEVQGAKLGLFIDRGRGEISDLSAWELKE